MLLATDKLAIREDTIESCVVGQAVDKVEAGRGELDEPEDKHFAVRWTIFKSSLICATVLSMIILIAIIVLAACESKD